jgi:hypothetical protein
MLSPLLALALCQMAQPAPTLSPVEAAQGYRLYTGADCTSLWRGYKQAAFPAKGWTFQDGVLAITKNGGGGDIITADQFKDLDLSFEFRLGEKSNSGIMFRVAETDGPTYMTGPEYQLLEDASWGAKPTDAHSCGALYDLYTPAEGKTMKPAGEWNHGRVYLRHGVLQHWLNGKKVVEARLYNDDGSPTKEWSDKIAGSKFKDWKGFGILPRGFVAIQDHGDTDLALRHVRMRDPSARTPRAQALFDGKSTDGWVGFVPELAGKPHVSPMAALATAESGVLTIKGTPIGYIRTERKYTNFILRLQWRFDPAKGAGNSGVLVRMVGEDKVWPKSVEAQLHSGNAGDFWNIGEFAMTTDPARTNGRNTRKTHAAERPVGEWNEYEIIVNKGDVVLYVNGEELNRATGVDEVAGHICLQSEGAQIQFREVWLTPLE